ncbi:MAG: Thiol-disulfide oxidoreductase ResA [Phycisphaerae bacterium]|nr:Thiol-disulfide oxidoreductase ResA [Phycisphaerae bacterium]
MKNRFGTLALGLGSLVIAGYAAAQATAEKKAPAAAVPAAEIGKPAPDFKLKDTEGKEHTLSSLKGKVVVLEWTNHTCPFVVYHQGEAKTMQKSFETFKGKDVVWLAIDSSFYCEEKKAGIQQWIKDKGISYPILLDASGQTGKAYGAKTTPHMFVIDRNGVLAYAGAIDDNPRKDKTTPRNYVIEAVNAALAGQTVQTAGTDPYGCSVKYKQ